MAELFNGLTTVNIELTNRCNKDCWMCGRRKVDKEYPEIALNYGDMDFDLVKSIAKQLPDSIVVQFHNNGEPLLYTRFGEAVKLFTKQIKCVNTNAKLILEKADDIIDNLDTLTISVIENDSEADEQYELVKKFLAIKGERKPNMIYRCLGSVDKERWEKLNGILVTRILHNPLGSFKYEKNPTIPEIGICLEILNHMAINRLGKVSICVRFDPKGLGVIGDVNTTPLADIWHSAQRKEWIKYHIEGNRSKIPLCSYCDFWGVPRGL
ncbi:MAG: radical SAM/SPASM domain-containing protein [Candidatus Omnitrophica bacterium]|nr:radical SAM/SPASM domain-containing protein [Candidatus Omnitrophota bacterium]